MRILPLAVVFLAAVAGLRAQTPPSSPAPLWLGDPGVDVAKARAVLRERQAARLRWEQATTVGDYERVGQKDPRWDADARACLDQFSHSLAQEPDAAARIEAAKAPCQRALAAGCTDPLLRYLGLRLGLSTAGTSPQELARLYAQAEADMEKSAYSPLRKLYSAFRAAEQAYKVVGSKTATGAPPPSPPGTDIPASLGRAKTHLIELLRDPAVDSASLYEIASDVFSVARHDVSGLEQVYKPLEGVFTSRELAATGETAKAKLIEGAFWADYAWQGRSSGWAKDVTDKGWELFAERLPKARAALEKAYALDPADPQISREMLTVELGEGQGRGQMETWFRRAMDANPDSYDACKAKLYYLEPKWYGDSKAMLDFGHQCQATGNWSARLPFILLHAHTSLAAYEQTPLAYWKRPEVWADLQGLYQAALAANPTSAFDRSGYALYAYRAEQWKLADELFQALGDKPNLAAMQCSKAQYDEMRRLASSRAQPAQLSPAP